VVLGIIEKITGYEREALEPDLDLEADLGIDTIKQAQVMARLRDQFGLPREQGIGVKDFPTIRHILEYVEKRHGGVSASPPSTDAATGTVSGGAEPDSQASPAASAASTLRPPKMPPGICRMAVRWATHEIDHESANATLGAGWTIVITDDGRGVAEALSRRLSGAGARVEILRHDQDLAPVRARLGRVRALVLLHPLATDPSVAALDADGWREVLQRKVIASFQAIKTLRAELEIAVGVTAMSGPYGWRGQLVDPAGAGVAGLLKSLRHEGDELLVKAVDVEPPATAAEADYVAELILGEVERGGPRVEVAYRDGARLVPRVIHEPLDLSGPEQRRLGPESVIIAIGGSRGVTAAVVKDLATRYHPRLELVGSRELPTNIAELAALDREGLKRLKETIARSWKARLKGIRPIEIEQKYAETLRAIEAFRTVRACEAAGASVRYHVCDVRNADRLARLIKGLARQHGRIDGVVFGAGVIEDKLIESKTLDSFRRVLGIKAEGMFNLYKALDGVPVSFLVAFSSVAGRFGNTGQTDYSAANEVTARFVCLMQAARPTSRCVAVDWTAWDEVGLAASSGVVELMKERGFEALAPSEGARMFREELTYGATPEEIVIASAHLPVDRDGQISAAEYSAGSEASDRPQAGVFIKAVPQYARGAWLSATTTLDPHVDTWLRDHTVEGTPLMPAVFAIDLMAEAATMLFPSLHVSSIEDLQLHLGVKVLKDRPTTLSVSATGRTGDSDDERIVRVRVTSDFARPDGRVLVAERLHYSCDLRLRSTAPAAERRDPLVQPGVDPGMVIPPLYGDGGALPHGPAFQVVERVDALDHQGATASLAEPNARGVLPALNGGRLLTLPFAREGAFQAAGLWAILRHGHFGLPHGCRMLRTYEPPLEGTPLVARVAPRAVDAARMEFDIEVVGPDGRVYDRMEGYYTVNPLEAAALAARRSESEAPL
jgi:NAD(P)-dependent dehydrogenase (short-subunit alcohol dehydrogenase family)